MSFASFPIESVGLTGHQIALCNRASLSTTDLLLQPASDLNRKLKLPRIDNVHDIVKTISKKIVPRISTVDQLLEAHEGHAEGSWVRTGDEGLDGALGGGLRVGTITEMTGESAAGKSHFCLSLALSAQLPSLSRFPGATMILTSEREIATDRLVELSKHLLHTHDPRGELRTQDLLDNVITNLCVDITALDHALAFKVPHLIRERRAEDHSPLMGELPAVSPAQNEPEGRARGRRKTPIRLLIIDSITALVRGADSAYGNSNMIGLTERSKHLCAITDKLKALAVEYSIAILVINQVSDVFTRQPPNANAWAAPSPSPLLSQFFTDGTDPPMLYATQSRWFSGQSDSLKKEASLGIVWANAVNVRIMLSRTGRRRRLDQKDLSKPKRPRPTGSSATPPSQIMPAPDPVIDDIKPTLIRRMHVVFSPFASPSTIDYAITTSGVHSLPDSYRLIDVHEARRRREKMARAIYGAQDDEEDDEAERRADPEQEQAVAMAVDGFANEVFDDYGELPADFWDGQLSDEAETSQANGRQPASDR